jgi:hypothetical protein
MTFLQPGNPGRNCMIELRGVCIICNDDKTVGSKAKQSKTKQLHAMIGILQSSSWSKM